MKQVCIKLFSSFIFILISIFSFGQSHYPGMFLISFTDKNQSSYSVDKPYEFLSDRSIERRHKYGVDIVEQDLPVNTFYIDSLKYFGAQPSFSSRWLNAVLVRMDDSLQMLNLLQLSFVDSMQYLAPIKKVNKKKVEIIKKDSTFFIF